MKSMDDLPNIDPSKRFAFSADLAEIVWPDVPEGYEMRFARQYEPANDVLPVHPDITDAIVAILAKYTDRWRCGVLFRWGSLWVGAHYAANHKRLCINLIPCVTIWIVAPGGDVP